MGAIDFFFFFNQITITSRFNPVDAAVLLYFSVIILNKPQSMTNARRLLDLTPMRSVILSVTARDALMKALSLSSYFIFISKNPAVGMKFAGKR